MPDESLSCPQCEALARENTNLRALLDLAEKRAAQTDGVSVDFFCGAIKLLTRQHGGRMTGPGMEQFRAGLAQAEQAFLRCPLESKSVKRRKAAQR